MAELTPARREHLNRLTTEVLEKRLNLPLISEEERELIRTIIDARSNWSSGTTGMSKDMSKTLQNTTLSEPALEAKIRSEELAKAAQGKQTQADPRGSYAERSAANKLALAERHRREAEERIEKVKAAKLERAAAKADEKTSPVIGLEVSFKERGKADLTVGKAIGFSVDKRTGDHKLRIEVETGEVLPDGRVVTKVLTRALGDFEIIFPTLETDDYIADRIRQMDFGKKELRIKEIKQMLNDLPIELSALESELINLREEGDSENEAEVSVLMPEVEIPVLFQHGDEEDLSWMD